MMTSLFIVWAASTQSQPETHSPAQLSSNAGHLSLSPGLMSPVSPTPTSEGSVSSLSTTPSSKQDKTPIQDHWQEETQDCINDEVLDDNSRGDIVRMLATLLAARHGPKPGWIHCKELARRLILKYQKTR